jgi:hypothetical protein
VSVSPDPAREALEAKLDSIERGWVDAEYDFSATDMHIPTLKNDLRFLIAALRVSPAVPPSPPLIEALEAAPDCPPTDKEYYDWFTGIRLAALAAARGETREEPRDA